MIQTSYVPLEHPYQIVEYNGTLGMQIGTLIVTKDLSDDDEDYAIETHSHPVVSYVNKRIRPDLKHHQSLSLPKPYEGVVWDKVELHELNTLAREDEKLRWRDYMALCIKLRFGQMEGRTSNIESSLFNIYGEMKDLGIEFILPQMSGNGQYKLKVELADIIKHKRKDYLYTKGDLGIIVEYDQDDYLRMMGQILSQAKFYISMLEHLGIFDCKVKFWTQDLFLQQLAESLNEEIKELLKDGTYLWSDDDDDNGMLMAAEEISPVEPDNE